VVGERTQEVEESEKCGVGELSIRATLQTEDSGEVEVE
jgi:hypothetical protein